MRSGRSVIGGITAIGALLALGWWQWGPVTPKPWQPAEFDTLRSLSLYSLPPLMPDPSNAFADDPRAAALGHRLFFESRLSNNGAVSCATCHQPERRFTDGLAKGRGVGLSARNTKSIVGSAYSPWQYWDGRKDSQWSQALSPLEDANEHGGNRVRYARLLYRDSDYRAAYETLFGPLPDFSDERAYPPDAGPGADPALQAAWHAMLPADRAKVDRVFANLGKALAAYERKLLPGESRFDRYVRALTDDDPLTVPDQLSDEELLGLQLFIGDARCTECHNGPLLTNNEFHNTGALSFPGELPDKGRIEGVRKVRGDPFNCRGEYSDDPAQNCAELEFARTGVELLGAMRTPSLRNLGGTAPYLHKGQLNTLEEVLDHYNRAPLAMIGHNEAEPLNLSGRQLRWLEAFLNTLDAPIDADDRWLSAPDR